MSKKGYITTILAVVVALQSVTNVTFGAEANVIQADPNMIQADPNWVQEVPLERINPEDAMVTLDFQGVLVSEVLEYLSQAAGLVVIADSYPSGRINVISKRPMNIDEITELINVVLNEMGYAAIRTDRTLKIVGSTEAKYLNIPVSTGSDYTKIADTAEIITHIVPIRYANAIRLVQDLNPLLSSETILTSNEASNSLIITDTKSNIRRLVRIVGSIDNQMSVAASVRVFTLEYADAENTADLINNIFEQQASGGSSSNSMQSMMQNMGGGGRGGRGGQTTQMPGGFGGASSTGGAGVAANIPVVADADERVNALVVSAPEDLMPAIAEVVKELDKNPSDERSLFVYNLKYAEAENVAERLNTLFQELGNINQQNARATGGGARGATTTSSSSSTDISDELYIEADADTNTLVIMTSPKNYEKIVDIIAKLDVPIPQVLIKVLIAELTSSDGIDIGINWDYANTDAVTGNEVSNLFNYNPKATEGLESMIIQGDLSITLRALTEVGTLNVLSRPYIMTSNNQEAVIQVGQRYPFVTDSTISNGIVNNTVDYEDIGIILTVTPSINIDGLVIMDVNPEITTALADTVQISDNVNATVFATRSAMCRVAVPNGETVVIGGLMEDTETDSVEKVPFLGDLPVLGGLFKHTKVDNTKTELLIFLTPQVAKSVEDLRRISDYERGKSKFLMEMESPALREHIDNMESVWMGESTEE